MPIAFAAESPAQARDAGTADDDLERRPHFETPAGPVPRPHHMRIPFQYDDDDVVYVHGVSIVPVDEKSEPRPFMLEEKGLDAREFAFALDRGGLRFFLSRLDRRSISVSKTGLMLSGKQESLRLQGVHEGVLNDLRAHGVVLPFEFGTIARTREELMMLIDEHLYDLHDAVDDLMATRERRLSSRQSAPAAKIDIKMLEKILGRQKRIAESVNEELKKVADRAEVEMMVGFSSGTSDDWKPILRAKYLVPPSRVHKLHRAINDIQYRHMLFELMLTLTGDQAAFALHAAR
jgi:Gas vesicle synthesis protein GvpL/GvpF